MRKYLFFLLSLILAIICSWPLLNNNFKEEKITTVYQEEKVEETNLIDANKKTVALTFDDGPSLYTDKIRLILKKYNANATFFMLGNKIRLEDKEKLLNLIKDGNEIGSHTYSHKILTKVKKSNLDYEIKNTLEILSNITNTSITLTRPPYGEINKYIRNNFDTSYILWSIDPKDWKYKDANKIYNHIIKNIEDGDIILLHETYYSTVSALEIILPKLKEMGYQVVTVSNLALVKGKIIENNKVYHSFK